MKELENKLLNIKVKQSFFDWLTGYCKGLKTSKSKFIKVAIAEKIDRDAKQLSNNKPLVDTER